MVHFDCAFIDRLLVELNYTSPTSKNPENSTKSDLYALGISMTEILIGRHSGMNPRFKRFYNYFQYSENNQRLLIECRRLLSEMDEGSKSSNQMICSIVSIMLLCQPYNPSARMNAMEWYHIISKGENLERSFADILPPAILKKIQESLKDPSSEEAKTLVFTKETSALKFWINQGKRTPIFQSG